MLRIPILLLLAGTLSAQAREEQAPVDVPQQLRLLQNGGPSQRAAAAAELGKAGSQRAVRPLMEALRYEDAGVQEAALIALNTIGDTSAAPEIRRFLYSPNGSLRMLAAMTLLHFRDEASLKTILDFLESEDANLRRETARMLTFVPLRDALPALEASLDDPDLQVRLYATEALGLIRDRASADKLAALLRSENEALRTAALMSLASTVPEDYKDELLDIFHHPSRLTRRVVTPLARLQDPEVEQMLLQQSPSAPILNFYFDPEASEKLRSTRLLIREFRWLNLEEIAELISKRAGVPVELSPSLPDPTKIRLAGTLGLLGYNPEAFAILNSLSPKYWLGTAELISFIIDDGKVVLVPPADAEKFFKERAEKKKSDKNGEEAAPGLPGKKTDDRR